MKTPEATVITGATLEPHAHAPGREGWASIVRDASSDQRLFKDVPWGKPMMWTFLLSDTFISAPS